MAQILETFKGIDQATIASTVEPPSTSNHQEADDDDDQNQPLSKAGL